MQLLLTYTLFVLTALDADAYCSDIMRLRDIDRGIANASNTCSECTTERACEQAYGCMVYVVWGPHPFPRCARFASPHTHPYLTPSFLGPIPRRSMYVPIPRLIPRRPI